MNTFGFRHVYKFLRSGKRFLRYRKTFKFRGFLINADLAARTGAPEKNYAMLAEAHEKILTEYASIASDQVVLEAACGTGMDAILLTKHLRAGRYTGFDIDRENIEWCKRHITPNFPNFRFIHLDLHESTYNPRGTLSALEVKFPEESGRVNRFIAQSLFTHLLPDVFEFYLREIHRVLHADGLALFSCFVGNSSEIENSITSDYRFFRFPHLYESGVYANNLESPTDAIVFEQQKFLNMIHDAGLTLVKLLPGSWAGNRSQHNFGQDIVILSHNR